METPPKVSQLLVVDDARRAGRRAAPARPLPRPGRLTAPIDAASARARARIRLLTCDVDGVLTDGTHLRRRRRPRDQGVLARSTASGINLLARAGIVVAWITGSPAPAVAHRARRLNVAARDPRRRRQARRRGTRCATSSALPPDECAHIGDDLPDMPVHRALRLRASRCRTRRRRCARTRTTSRRATAASGAVRELAELHPRRASGVALHGVPPPRA